MTTTDLHTVKQRLCDEVDRWADELLAASHDIHAHPELGFEERHAHEVLTGLLDKAGLAVERHVGGLDTAFRAPVGSTGPTVAVLCEYDALPGLGHACGHNIIGTAGIGAGLAAAALADEVGGRLLVLGTPAEEGGGGKVALAKAGLFDGVDAAMMVHPAGLDLTRMFTLAVQQLFARYHGKAAHAAAAPHVGRNALDAAVLGYMNVAALRQHIRPTERVHGIFVEGGAAANVVPDRAVTHWYIRSPRLSLLDDLKARVVACLEAGAHAAGCNVEFEWIEPVYADMVDIPVLIDAYITNAAALGREVIEPADNARVAGSTDMGNISHLVPSIHPMIQVSPPGVAIHTKDFVEWAASSDGDRAVIDGAKALAMTVADLWLEPNLLDHARQQFAEAMTRGSG